ncbi:MAG: spermidine synthase, partial [Deltaproteobacteria bacterium]|nr:spermidine synthase [Deltaproteobacteria bacterium]
RVLLGGLGLGFTLRAALDALPRRAQLVVAELHERVVQWNRGPVASLNGAAVADPRVRVIVGDVTREIRRLANDAHVPRYDAILWDLYVGPTRKGGRGDPLYGDRSLADTCAALEVGGVFGVWAEAPSKAFEERLGRHGMTPRLIPVGRGMRHAVYLATKQKPKARRAPAPRRRRKARRR